MTFDRLRVAVFSLALAVCAATSGEAASLLPFTVPPPEITKLVPFAAPPFEKPSLTIPDLTVPSFSVDAPTVPPIPVSAASRSTATSGGAKPDQEVGTLRDRALSLYASGKYADAARVWSDLSKRSLTAEQATDVALWYGDTLGRLGDHRGAEQQLKAFVTGARPGSIREHPMLATGLVRLGWWTFAAGRASDSIATFKRCFAGPCNSAGKAEQDWAGAGLALAFNTAGDWNNARSTAHWLTTRKAEPAGLVSLTLMRTVVESKNPQAIQAMAQEVLAGPLTPTMRAWVLVMKGEAARRDGNRDEARTQYEMAQRTDSGSSVGAYATYRLALANFEMREFGQAAVDLEPVLKSKIAAEVRVAALLLQGEAAYRAKNYATASAAFRRLLVESPRDPQAALIQLSLPWAACRQGQKDEARTFFLEFVKSHPDHPNAADALMMAVDTTAGDGGVAKQQLDKIITRYPTRLPNDFARLNRAILMVRSGQHVEAQGMLRDWIARAPYEAGLARAHAALGAALLATAMHAKGMDTALAGEAAREFAAAQKDDASGYASLGAGIAAMLRKQFDEAGRALTAARDAGAPEIASIAEYALAEVALERGNLKAFKQPALNALKASPSGPSAPPLMYVLTGIALEEKDLPGAFDLAKKLAQQFPTHDAADDAIERVGAAAAKIPNWPVVYEAYSLLRQRYPTSPFVDGSKRLLAEAAFQTGHMADARRDLEHVVTATPNDGALWIMLAKARSTTGDRPGAIDAYTRAASVTKLSEWPRETVLDNARLLVLEKRWQPARTLFEGLLKSNDQFLVLESTCAIGDTYRGEGNLLAATQYYMTAAYIAPESPFGRRALLAAGQAFGALKQSDSAATMYKKLLAQANVPAELVDAARQGLESLGRAEKP